MNLRTIERIQSNDPTLVRVDLSNAEDLLFVEGNTSLEHINVFGRPKKNFDSVLRIPSLRKLQLGGSIVENLDLFRTATLQELEILYGKITSLEPLRFNTSMKCLNLTSNHVKSLDILATNTTLVALYLDRNQIESLDPLNGNTTLKMLYVENSIIESIEPLRGNSALTHLRLIGNPIEDISPLTGNMSVVSLGLDRTMISDISPLGSMLNLRSLSISGTSIETIHSLKWCVALEDIQMNHTRVSDMSPLGCLPHLVKIEAMDNEFVTDISFVKCLVSIEKVHMSRCRIKHLPDLGGCLHLTTLTLCYNLIETADVWSHSGCHNNLCEVNLSNNSLSNIDFLRGCTYVAKLMISHNGLRNIDAIEHVDFIHTLVATCNDITHIPSNLPVSLQSLHLDSNNIRDFSPLWGNTHIMHFSYIPQRCPVNEDKIKILVDSIINNIHNHKLRLISLRKISILEINFPI